MRIDDRTGLRIGRYRLLSLLGRGGMGTVYLAEHEGLGSFWVAKLLHQEFAGTPSRVERFLHEARALAALRHPNIVQVVDVDCTDSIPYFIMEHLEGEDLQAMLQRTGPLPWRDARDIALQVCAAMSVAHHRGIVHRDIKPANLFCVPQASGSVLIKVLDFGIAKLILTDLDDVLTTPGVALGTPVYMAPERLLGADATPCSDVYSLGLVLYRLLTDRLPFHGNGTTIPSAARSSEMLDPHSFPSDVPASLVKVLAAALHRDPGQRIASMAELSDELMRVTDDPARPSATRAVASPNTRARTSPLWLGAAMLTIMAVGLAASQAFDTPPAATPNLAEPAREPVTATPKPPANEPPPLPVEVRPPDCSAAITDDLESFSRHELHDCGRRHRARPGDTIKARLAFDGAGQARRITLSPSYYEDEPFGVCVRQALRERKVAACSGAPPRTVNRTFVYGRRGST